MIHKTAPQSKCYLLKTAILVLAFLSRSHSFITTTPSFFCTTNECGRRRAASLGTSMIMPSPSSAALAAGRKNENDLDDGVKVNLIKDIDPLTITAVGFSLIALNFFVLANMGDGGIGGIVASIINHLN